MNYTYKFILTKWNELYCIDALYLTNVHICWYFIKIVFKRKMFEDAASSKNDIYWQDIYNLFCQNSKKQRVNKTNYLSAWAITLSIVNWIKEIISKLEMYGPFSFVLVFHVKLIVLVYNKYKIYSQVICTDRSQGGYTKVLTSNSILFNNFFISNFNFPQFYTLESDST